MDGDAINNTRSFSLTCIFSREFARMNLQVELFGGLSRHKLHRGALDRLSDCLGLAESRSYVRTRISSFLPPACRSWRCQAFRPLLRHARIRSQRNY
jgi:hypothetical protein